MRTQASGSSHAPPPAARLDGAPVSRDALVQSVAAARCRQRVPRAARRRPQVVCAARRVRVSVGSSWGRAIEAWWRSGIRTAAARGGAGAAGAQRRRRCANGGTGAVRKTSRAISPPPLQAHSKTARSPQSVPPSCACLPALAGARRRPAPIKWPSILCQTPSRRRQSQHLSAFGAQNECLATRPTPRSSACACSRL